MSLSVNRQIRRITRVLLNDCVASYRKETRDGIKNRLHVSISVICDESRIYDEEASQHNWSIFQPHTMVNKTLSKEDMCDIYDSKFVKVDRIKNKYYDHLMSLANTGKCPICGIGQASTLDHYLAKTIYPTYAVTPYNLVPVCKDCNFAKSDSIMIPDSAPLHPYYDEIDSTNWLKARLIERDEGIVAEFSVSQDLQKSDFCLYQRLKRHMDLYHLNKAYAVQSITEIAENLPFWKKKYKEWGREEFKTYLTEVLAAKESFQYNTWNTALLKALIENIDIVSEK